MIQKLKARIQLNSKRKRKKERKTEKKELASMPSLSDENSAKPIE